jgi:hypothetical protein
MNPTQFVTLWGDFYRANRDLDTAPYSSDEQLRKLFETYVHYLAARCDAHKALDHMAGGPE